jgi:Zn-dependent protease
MTQHHVTVIYQIIVFLFALCVHESAHAWVAWRLGDPTARMLGRATLNPVRHIDPVGTILIPVLCYLSGAGFFFGWAKPVPVDLRNFRNPVRDDVLVSIAGPASNFLLAIVSIIALRLLAMTGGTLAVAEPLALLLWFSMLCNVGLGIFNLIPVPPLDGSHVLRHLLPAGARGIYDRVGMIGLVVLFLAGGSFVRFFSEIVQSFLVQTFLRGI